MTNWAIESYNEADIEFAWWENTYTYFSWMEYNQKDVSSRGCVFYAAATQVSNLTKYFFSKTQFEEMRDIAYDKYGWREWVWMYVWDWANLIVDYRNKLFPDNPIYKYYVNIKDLWFKGMVHTGINANNKFYNDAQDNGSLDNNPYWAREFWHSINIMIDTEQYILDNYKWDKKYNIYKCNLKELINEWFMFNWWYIYNFIKPQMPTIVLPEHITVAQTIDNEEKDIIIAWEQELSTYLSKNPDYKTYRKYVWKHWITRMLIDLNKIRNS